MAREGWNEAVGGGGGGGGGSYYLLGWVSSVHKLMRKFYYNAILKKTSNQKVNIH